MSGGHRGEYIAVGLVALATVALGIWNWPQIPVLHSYSYSDPRNENYQPGGKDCDPAKLTVASKATRKRDACAKDAEEYRQNSDDLIQQTRAADAAQAQADIASQSLWLTLFQTLGGFLTLFAAGAAAWFARDAANHTKDSVSETRRIGEAQVRGYLTGVSAQVGFTPGGGAIINCVVRNTGQSPIRRIAISGDLAIQVGPEKYNFFKIADAAHENMRWDIGGGGAEETLTFGLKDASMEGWVPDGTRFYISIDAKLVGKDVFDLPVAETEKFAGFPTEQPAVNDWIELGRIAKFV
jgi:hypothetical protein